MCFDGIFNLKKTNLFKMSTIPIYLRNTPEEHKKLEIIDHPFIISYFAEWYKVNLYVEYGISTGACLKKVLPYCKKAWGVDLNPIPFHANNLEFFNMSTRDFKKVLISRNPVIDMAFIDACHQSDVVLQDFDDLFPYIIDDGLIFLHDTYPIDVKFTEPNYCNDCWKTPDLIRNKYGSAIDIITFPIMPGLTIVRKRGKVLLPWMAN